MFHGVWRVLKHLFKRLDPFCRRPILAIAIVSFLFLVGALYVLVLFDLLEHLLGLRQLKFDLIKGVEDPQVLEHLSVGRVELRGVTDVRVLHIWRHADALDVLHFGEAVVFEVLALVEAAY